MVAVTDLGQPDRAALRAMREASGMTPADLAGLLGLTTPHYINIENGKRWMPGDAIRKIVTLLGDDGLFHFPNEQTEDTDAGD